MKYLFLLLTSLTIITWGSSCTKRDDINFEAIYRDAWTSDSTIRSIIGQKNESAYRDPSGLYYVILKPGDSVHYLTPTSIPIVSYSYQLLNGSVVASSFGPTDFDNMQLKNHIAGWQIGLRKISKGGRIRMYIPPELAFGSIGVPTQNIPPNAILISEVELVDIR